MPKGENLKGPFKGIPHDSGVVAIFDCSDCKAQGHHGRTPIRVNGHGWFYVHCSKLGCGVKRTINNMTGAKTLIKKAKKWRRGSKKVVYQIAGLIVTNNPPAPPFKSALEPRPATAPPPEAAREDRGSFSTIY